MATTSDLGSLLRRLEKATARLEEVAAGRSSQKTGSPAAAAGANSTDGGLAGDAGSDHPAVREYDAVVKPLVDEFAAYSEQIGDVVETQAKAVGRLVSAQRNFIRIAVQTSKPPMDQLPSLLEPQQAAMVEVIGLKDSNRPSQYYNHLSTVAEGIAAFGWVAVEPTPVPYINDMKDSAQFYGNRVLKEWKEKDEVHAKWVRAFLSALRELAAYVKQFHTTGAAWNPKGVSVEQALKAIKGGAVAPAAAPAPAPAPAAGGAPPPPPPPPPPMVTDFEDSTSGSSGATGQSRGALFAELSKGDAITSGLRKVDKSEMTHKNPTLRTGSAVSQAPAPAAAASKPKAQASQGPPRMELQGNKWIIENHGAEQLVVETTDIKQTVYIYNCSGTTVQVKNKINGIVIDNCHKCGVVFDALMSSCEIVNSKSVQVQAIDAVPTILIDRTDGAHVFLSEKARDGTQITTAKVSEVNVSYPFETSSPEDDDFVEQPIPEQFQTVVKNGKLVTTVLEHSA
ncbi:hypothetical protein GQ54DRAFT_220475 [Martensiomyces pterosporus]|nr:hypothetical protein GQ54DRAFT_220475 [Martensiomyces pterosporus]